MYKKLMELTRDLPVCCHNDSFWLWFRWCLWEEPKDRGWLDTLPNSKTTCAESRTLTASPSLIGTGTIAYDCKNTMDYLKKNFISFKSIEK